MNIEHKEESQKAIQLLTRSQKASEEKLEFSTIERLCRNKIPQHGAKTSVFARRRCQKCEPNEHLKAISKVEHCQLLIRSTFLRT